jgi:hypothetical protein
MQVPAGGLTAEERPPCAPEPADWTTGGGCAGGGIGHGVFPGPHGGIGRSAPARGNRELPWDGGPVNGGLWG